MKFSLLIVFTLLSSVLQAQNSKREEDLTAVMIVVFANLTLTLITLIFTYFQNTKSYRIEAKKILITEQMKAHQELYSILMKGMTQQNSVYSGKRMYSMFQSMDSYNEWSKQVWLFVDCNSVYLSKDVQYAYTKLYHKREYIMQTIDNDIALQELATAEFIEITMLFDGIMIAIGKFFEKDMYKNYEFTNFLRLPSKGVQ
jgi:hypothetical protein